jgi:hypothetical protein
MTAPPACAQRVADLNSENLVQLAARQIIAKINTQHDSKNGKQSTKLALSEQKTIRKRRP